MEIEIHTEHREKLDLIKVLDRIATEGNYEDTFRNLRKFITKLKSADNIKVKLK